MRHGIHGLEQLADRELFQVLIEGIPLIVNNVVELAASADSLFQSGHRRTSLIPRGAAEEEAGKALVLIDYVRCPRDWDRRGKVLARFTDHVPELIHGEACSYPGIHTFCEMFKHVKQGCEQWYLDGPNGIDWIFPNEIRTRRERNLYVDYVRDPTVEGGVASWWPEPFRLACWCVTPDSVRLVRGLVTAGARSVKGLAVIAEVWRRFELNPDTDRAELRRMNAATLDRVMEFGDPIDDDVRSFVISHWPFRSGRSPWIPEDRVTVSLHTFEKSGVTRLSGRRQRQQGGIRSRRFPERRLMRLATRGQSGGAIARRCTRIAAVLARAVGYDRQRTSVRRNSFLPIVRWQTCWPH